MARNPAQVFRGARGPILRGGEQVVPTAQQGVPIVPVVPSLPARPGVRRFVADAIGYRLTVTMPDDIRDPATGRKVSIKGKSAQFKQGYFETDDPEIIEHIEKSNAFAVKEIRDLDVAEAEQRVTAAESLVSIIQNSTDPAVRRKVLEALGVEVKDDFELPKGELANEKPPFE